MRINNDSLKKIIEANANEPAMLKILTMWLKTFENYHSAIYEAEIFKTLHDYRKANKDEYMLLEAKRTDCHNAVLKSLKSLNERAEKMGLPLIYDDVISEEHPYRRYAADAVLAYVKEIIKERR